VTSRSKTIAALRLFVLDGNVTVTTVLTRLIGIIVKKNSKCAHIVAAAFDSRKLMPAFILQFHD
jgi:DNA-binding transcriptional regulator LsrR (DeoR family)